MLYEYHKDHFTITTNPDAFDVDAIHSYLTRSYWKRGVSKELVKRSIKHSFCFGLFAGDQQIGFARVITDHTDFAYLCDVFVLEPYQGQGLGQWLLATLLACPALEGIRHFMLATRDAHEFYRKFGFQEVKNPERWMFRLADKPWFQPSGGQEARR